MRGFYWAFAAFVTLSACKHRDSRQVIVEEWNQGYPKPQAVISASETEALVAKYSVSMIGQDTYSEGESKVTTVDATGKETRSVAQKSNDTFRYYSLESFRPVLFEMAPEAEDDLKSAETYQMGSGISMSLALGAAGLGAIVAGPVVIPAYSVMTLLFTASQKFNELSDEKYSAAKIKYVSALNDIFYGKRAKIADIAQTEN